MCIVYSSPAVLYVLFTASRMCVVLCLQQPGTPTQIVADIKEMIEEDSNAGGGGALLPFGSYKISRNGGFGTLKRLMSDKEVSTGC